VESGKEQMVEGLVNEDSDRDEREDNGEEELVGRS
jgi:hypothetical protein